MFADLWWSMLDRIFDFARVARGRGRVMSVRIFSRTVFRVEKLQKGDVYESCQRALGDADVSRRDTAEREDEAVGMDCGVGALCELDIVLCWQLLRLRSLCF